MSCFHRSSYQPYVIGIVIFIIVAWIGLKDRPTDHTGRDIRALKDVQIKNIAEEPLCKVNGLTSKEEFYEYFKNIEYKCNKSVNFGINDGMKTVCMDPVFHLTPGNCNVLSFGINNEWSFDDTFDTFGCKVFSFDPTMGKEDHQRSPNIRFFNLGIGNIQGKRRVGMDSNFHEFDVDRYENIIERLGLTNNIIDYIKMDVEISELDFLYDITRNSPHLLKNIRQMAIELHHGYKGQGIKPVFAKNFELDPTSTYVIFWEYFQELKCHGFRLTTVRRAGAWTEVVWSNF